MVRFSRQCCLFPIARVLAQHVRKLKLRVAPEEMVELGAAQRDLETLMAAIVCMSKTFPVYGQRRWLSLIMESATELAWDRIRTRPTERVHQRGVRRGALHSVLSTVAVTAG